MNWYALWVCFKNASLGWRQRWKRNKRGPELTVAVEWEIHGGVTTLFSPPSYRLDIFYTNQKKKRFLKSRWRPFPTERRTWLRQRRWVAAHCKQETANSRECWSTPFQSKQEAGGWGAGCAARDEAGSQEGWYPAITCWLVNERKSSGNAEHYKIRLVP